MKKLTYQGTNLGKGELSLTEQSKIYKYSLIEKYGDIGENCSIRSISDEFL